ncbi:MAG TPA: DUF6361 family protein [Thermomicrobiales bacterium]|nr:DUF6361 family protein [Thermomicrobiales bacterium]
MASSAFGWLDHDERERRRMMEVVNLFREKGTLDELGIGTIRDTIADRLFPGTSTIQTRARYFVFIPWIYVQIERDRVPSNRVDVHARKLQWQLVQSLKAGGEGSNAGIIGIEAGENVQRLPSDIYWQGLGRWGIRLAAGSTERYQASIDAVHRHERQASMSDGAELLTSARRSWDGSLPSPPSNFLEETTFALTRDEAEYLSERIQQSCPDSLLAGCMRPSITRKRQSRTPWDLNGLESLSTDLQQDIADARRYSLVMEGAVLLYNLMLAERAVEWAIASDSSRIEHYSNELHRWAGEMAGTQDDLEMWDRSRFWNRMYDRNPRLHPGSRQFSESWLQLAIVTRGSIREDDAARALIRARERRLKSALARLHNPRALERWSGASGVGQMTYRWGNAQRILRDILDGLDRPAGATNA